MQLERVRIQNYKCLRDVTVEFRRPAGAEDGFSAQFLVGLNGSGKSCFLEALGLIFTRIMQGEGAGFPFTLEYRIQRGRTWVKVRSADQTKPSDRRLEITVVTDGETQSVDRLSDEHLPQRIVACSSGANHQMGAVLLSFPRASLVSDLYDLASRQDKQGSEAELNWLLAQYRALDADSRVFNIDGKTARLIVPVLLAIVPNFADQVQAASHFRLRDELFRRVSSRFRPVAFSIIVDESKLYQVIAERQNSPQYGLLAKLLRKEPPDGSSPLHSWMVRRPALPPAELFDEESEPPVSQTAVFCYESWPDCAEEGWMWNRRLSEEFNGDPMLLLNVLMAAQQRDLLLDAQLAFHSGEQQALLGLETLSDGELMWLARMGLVLMSRLSRSAETLFLFDEPDVHFNNEWNMDFVKTLRQCSETQEERLHHEFVIATHSTLLLTDTYPEQINLFSAAEREGIQVEEPPVSPFAAQQDELARYLFSASAVGSYAMEQVDSRMERAQTPEEIMALIRQTGPGYQRFRLYERYHELIQRQR